MKKININKIFHFIIATAVSIGLSILAKTGAMYCINNNVDITNKVFEIFFVRNTGAAFSILSSYTDILIDLSIAVLIVITLHVINNSKKISILRLNSLAILSAGILGNLIERIRDGYVTDYIKLNFVNFPVFNASDALITLGAVLLIITLYKNK